MCKVIFMCVMMCNLMVLTPLPYLQYKPWKCSMFISTLYLCSSDYQPELASVLSGEKPVPDFYLLEDRIFEQYRKSTYSHQQSSTEIHLPNVEEYRSVCGTEGLINLNHRYHHTSLDLWLGSSLEMCAGGKGGLQIYSYVMERGLAQTLTLSFALSHVIDLVP